MQVIAGIVGVPVEDHERFQQWANDITSVAIDHDRAIVASQAMAAYLLPMVHERRAEPGRDLIGGLVAAEVDGQRLTDERILGFLRLLLPAGAETTYRAMGNCLLRPAHPSGGAPPGRTPIEDTDPRSDRGNHAVGDLDHHRQPQRHRRRRHRELPVPAGAGLMLMVSSANRDETRYDHSSEWDIDRAPRSHLHFGHRTAPVPGHAPRRLELRVGLNAVLDRLPDLRLQDRPPRRSTSKASPSGLRLRSRWCSRRCRPIRTRRNSGP